MTDRPRLERPPVRIPRLAGPLAAVWEGICALADAVQDAPWTVIGGQMVFLHAAEDDVAAHRLSADIDAAVDVRADPGAMRKVVTALVDLGFSAAGASPEGTACRFEKRGRPGTATVGVVTDNVLAVDLLAPEGLGPRADLTTIGSATAFVAPGVSQALARTELVPVTIVAGQHWVPRPNLLGAVVAKATASTVDNRDRERHLADPPSSAWSPIPSSSLATSPARTGNGLRTAAAALPADHPAWRFAPVPSDASAALEILAR